jgi:hypothetical protein
MKKLVYSKAFWYIVLNVIIVGAIVGSILYTLTYKSVPLQYQHEWFGNDLHTFLVFDHSFTLGSGVICLAICNFGLACTLPK